MDSTLVYVALGLVALMVGVWAVKRQAGGPTSLREASDLVYEAMSTARTLVEGAEQLWQSGQLPKDERFYAVFEPMERMYPNLDRDALRLTIEAAVRWLRYVQQERGGQAAGPQADG